jgi:hypothetical protein
MVNGVPYGLRHPRRLTVLATAGEAPNAVFYALRAASADRSGNSRPAAATATIEHREAARETRLSLGSRERQLAL